MKETIVNHQSRGDKDPRVVAISTCWLILSSALTEIIMRGGSYSLWQEHISGVDPSSSWRRLSHRLLLCQVLCTTPWKSPVLCRSQQCCVFLPHLGNMLIALRPALLPSLIIGFDHESLEIIEYHKTPGCKPLNSQAGQERCQGPILGLL